MVSGMRLVEICLIVLVIAALAIAFFVTGVPFVKDRIEESISAAAFAAVAPVVEELYPTPVAGQADPDSPPAPNIEAARARFVEGGELLPGGGKLCLRPDGSGSILKEEIFKKYCPAEFR